MLRRLLVVAVTCAAIAGSQSASTAGWPVVLGRATAVNPLWRSLVPHAPTPAPQIRPHYVEGPSYGVDAPAFRWGYFGAHSGSQCTKSSGYYGDRDQWTFRLSD